MKLSSLQLKKSRKKRLISVSGGTWTFSKVWCPLYCTVPPPYQKSFSIEKLGLYFFCSRAFFLSFLLAISVNPHFLRGFDSYGVKIDGLQWCYNHCIGIAPLPLVSEGLSYSSSITIEEMQNTFTLSPREEAQSFSFPIFLLLEWGNCRKCLDTYTLH